MKHRQCRLCAKSFSGGKSKPYCSPKCKYDDWQANKTMANPCYYCGMPADTVDHVPPRSVRPTIMAEAATRWAFVEVDACRECNCYLGARQPWVLNERKEKIKKWLKRRYASVLRIPECTEDEIDDLGRNGALGTYVANSVYLQRLVKQRISW